MIPKKLPSKKYRWTDPTPAYWRKVRNYALATAGFGASLLAQELVELPEIALTIAGYLAAAGGAVAVFAQTAHGNE